MLLVEDDADLATILKQALEDANYSVAHASNGLDGLKRFGEGHWDAVVTDRSMPGMNGESMAEQIRGRQPDQTIILMTGLATAVSHRELFDEILIKPFRIAELLACLDRKSARVSGYETRSIAPSPESKHEEIQGEISELVRRALVQVGDLKDAEEKLKAIAQRSSRFSVQPAE
jgi:DNA-binding response OmpR family regulator